MMSMRARGTAARRKERASAIVYVVCSLNWPLRGSLKRAMTDLLVFPNEGLRLPPHCERPKTCAKWMERPLRVGGECVGRRVGAQVGG